MGPVVQSNCSVKKIVTMSVLFVENMLRAKCISSSHCSATNGSVLHTVLLKMSHHFYIKQR